MQHSEDVTAVIAANEPPDGTTLVVQIAGGEWKVIRRDDHMARIRYSGDPGGHVWTQLGDSNADPMTLHQYLKYADAVYALGDKLAEFGR